MPDPYISMTLADVAFDVNTGRMLTLNTGVQTDMSTGVQALAGAAPDGGGEG